MLIKLQNISKDYIDDGLVTPALCGVSFNIEQGEFLAIMGASGSGKSTLMHILGFLDKPTGGAYFFENRETSGFNNQELAEIRNQKVGFIFQSYNLLARTSVLENVLLPTIYGSPFDKKDLKNRALTLLEKVGLRHRVYHLPNQLSGGEQQRVAIVRALINQPRLILADEPTGNLDSKSGQGIMEILKELNREGNTIVMVTHDQEIAKHARRVVELKDGTVVTDRKQG